MMKLHLVGDEIAKGQGVGRGSVVGKTVVANSASDLEGVDLSESVIVTNSVDETLVPYIEQAVGLLQKRMVSHHQVRLLDLKKYSNHYRC